MNNVSNIDSISKEFMYDPDFQTKVKTILVGDSVGSEKLCVNIDFVKPGGESTKYHSHSQQEEFFLIMSGSGVLRLNGDLIPIKTGDVLSKPAGKDIAHQFINTGSEILQILDIAIREKEDVITYPDEGNIYIKNKNMVFRMEDNVKNWTSEPNQ